MLVEKTTLVVVEMIDVQNLFSRPITHETKVLTITIGSHNSKVVFNIISFSTNPIIIELSWLVLHNPRVDWKMKSFHFESVNETTPKYKGFPTSTLFFEHDSTSEDRTRTSQHMHKFKPKGDIGGNQRSKHFKPLFMGARAFIQTTKKGDAFFVYAILALDLRTQQHEIPIQYQDYKDIFEKKNANTLPKHWSYDCAIDLEEGVQPLFRPIYNLLQDEFSTI